MLFLLAEQRKGWSLMIFCARATRGLRRMGRAAWSSSCSRNAHDRNVRVRRAQSRIKQATLENEMGNWKEARSGRSISPIPRDVTSKLGESMSIVRCAQ